MENHEFVSIWFAFHFVLFSVKAWAVYKAFTFLSFITSKSHAHMVIFNSLSISITAFSILMIGIEVWFICYFLINKTVIYYEYLTIIDEVFFTIVTILLLSEGKKNVPK